MSKPRSKPGKSKRGSGAVQLDDKISEVTTKAVRGFRRNMVLVLSAIAIVIVALVAGSMIDKFQDQEKKSYMAEAHALFSSISSRDADVVAVIPEVNRLLSSVRGKSIETHIYRDAVSYLLNHAKMALLPGGSSSSLPGQPAPPGNDEPETTLEKSQVPDVLEKTRAIVADAQNLFADDADMQNWASESLKRIESLRELGSESVAPNRGYSAPLPGASE